jgi:hypothetical protein
MTNPGNRESMPPSDQAHQRSDPAWLADRTAAYLRAWERRYRKCWRRIGELRAYYTRRHPEDLPAWCWIPSDAVLHYFTAESAWSFLDASRELGVAGDTDLVALTALAAWRQTKGIYQVDPDLAREVVATRLDDRLPVQVLKRLPAWCCYLASGEAIGPAAGFYVFLDWVVLARHAALTFVFDLDTPQEQGLLMDWSVPLVEGSSVRTAIRQAVEVARDHPGRPRGLARSLGSDRLLDEFLFPALALTLYLCAGNADIVPGQLRSGAPTAGRRQAGGGIPGEPQAWEVGWRIGAALRAARPATGDTPRHPAATGRAAPRPHIRRPHWQSFRVGPGRPNERTDSVVHWISLIQVNLDPYRPDGGLVTTIRPVPQDPEQPPKADGP